MSDFGMFEADEAAAREPRAQARTAARQMDAAIDVVRAKFGRFLLGATGVDEFGDRWHYSKHDIRAAIEPHVFPNTGTMRRVHNALKQDWKLAHPYKLAEDRDAPIQDLDETYRPDSGNLIPEGDFEGYKDGVDQDGPAKVQRDFTPGGDSGRSARRRQAGEDNMFSPGPGQSGGSGLGMSMSGQEASPAFNPGPMAPGLAAGPQPTSGGMGWDGPGTGGTVDMSSEPAAGSISSEPGLSTYQTRSASREAAMMVADIYTDFARANGLRVASLDTLDRYAATGIHEADYRLLQNLIVAACECDDDDKDSDDDSEAPSESESDDSDSGDDEGDAPDFGGESGAESHDEPDADDEGGESDGDEDNEDDEDSEGGDDDDYDFGGDDEGGDSAGGQQYTVPEQAPDLDPQLLDEIPHDDPQGAAPVPPEVIDSLLGLPEGTIEQLLLEEVEQGQGGAPETGGAPQGGGDDFFGGGGDDAEQEPPRVARRRRAAFGQDDMTDEEMWGEYERQREDAIREHQTRQHPSGVNVHTFGSTGEAYDKSQYLDGIKHGDILSVPSEKAIAVLDQAWPIPLTQTGGAFGDFKSDDHRAGWHARNREELGSSIAAAQDEAGRIGVPLHPVFGGGRQARRRSLARQFWAADDDSESSSESGSSGGGESSGGGGGQQAPAQPQGDPNAGAAPMDPTAMGGAMQPMMPPPGSQAVAPPAPPQPLENQPAEDALLDTANQAIMQMIDQETAEYQQIIDPLSKALQAIQFAQQVEQTEHPMDVTPPQGTVDVSPAAAPGGAANPQQQLARLMRQARKTAAVNNAATLIARTYGVSERMLREAMGRRNYEHTAEAFRILPPHLRHLPETRAAARHIGEMFAADNPRFNKDAWMKAVLASNPRDRAGDAWRDGRDRGIAEHGRHDLDDFGDEMGDAFAPRGRNRHRPGGFDPNDHDEWVDGTDRQASRGRLPFESARRLAGETWSHTPTMDAFEFPNAGEVARVDDNNDTNNLPVMKGADPHGKNAAASSRVVDRFQRWQRWQQQRGLPATDGEASIHNFLQTRKPGKPKVGDEAAAMIHREQGLTPDAPKVPKAKPMKAVNPTLKQPKAAPKAPKTASFFTRRVPGWRWDDHLSGYLSKEAKAFTCSCGQKHASPSYNTCKCGKIWNIYAIGDTHHLASDTAEVFIAREIPVRDNVIMANRRLAGFGPENLPAEWTDTCPACGSLETQPVGRDEQRNCSRCSAIWTTGQDFYAPGRRRLHDPEERAKEKKYWDDLSQDRQFGANRKMAKGDGGCTCWEGYERVPGTEPCASKSCRKKTGATARAQGTFKQYLAEIERLADWTKYDDPDPVVEAYGKTKPPSTTVSRPPKDWAKRKPKGDPSKRGGTWESPPISRKPK